MLRKCSIVLSRFKYVFSTVCIYAETDIGELSIFLRQIDLAKHWIKWFPHFAHSLGTLDLGSMAKVTSAVTV